jgi:hypothetical protein
MERGLTLANCRSGRRRGGPDEEDGTDTSPSCVERSGTVRSPVTTSTFAGSAAAASDLSHERDPAIVRRSEVVVSVADEGPAHSVALPLRQARRIGSLR